MELTLKRYARVAALGALGVAAGSIALYALIGWVAWPAPRGGMNQAMAALTLISVSIPIAALIAAHLIYARILLRYGSQPSRRE
jgi:hypothetical protein